MKKFTASYASVKDNFVILNNDIRYKNGDAFYGLFCVVQNIIQRGKPSIASRYLQETLGELDIFRSRQLYLVSSDVPEWNVIKGDDSEIYYPAEHFYYNLLPKYLGEDSIARNLIIPEVDFRDVIKKSTALDGQQVDFFCPQLKTVIEIDGSSHKQTSQLMKDNIRDDALRKADITVLRISTDDICNESANFKARMGELKKAFDNASILSNLFTNDDCEQYGRELRYDAVMRLEVLLLELLRTGRLNLKDNIWNIHFVFSDIKDIDFLLKTAFEDLKLWFSNIAQMMKLEITYPKIDNSDDVEAVKVDFSLFKRYTDKEMNESDCVFIRNDYFLENDYYQISSADTLQYIFTPESEERDNQSLKFVLRNIFPDIEDFRDGQPQIIKNVLMRKDTIGILPTGTGKSLCYQLSAMLQPGVTIVIVPIISLMIDQQESMNRRFINHINAISSATSGEEKEKILNAFEKGKYQFLWISPERFQNANFRKSLESINRKMNFAFAIIDEVHCLSEWGHDFRVSYLALIRILREYCPEATLLGLTATASQAVLEDLKAEFEVDGEAVKALTNMDRPELVFHREYVSTLENKHDKLYSLIKENQRTYVTKDGKLHEAIGLVFCPTVDGRDNGCNKVINLVDNKAKEDKKKELRLAAYHAKLTNEERIKIQNQFMRNQYNILMCTKAFGMGIDQPNIKYTIHYSMPQSIESFYQEAGRAGRDIDKSVESHCYILFYPEPSYYSKSEGIIKEIFDPNTDINRRKYLSKLLNGDLSTIMYFWNKNKDTREEEYKRLSKVLKRLYNGEMRLEFNNRDNGDSLQSIQMSLYKMSLLGIVKNWTIDYMALDKGVVNVEYVGLEEKTMRNSLLTYINKYDPEFQFDEQSTNYRKYYEIAHDEKMMPITRLINILIEWTNENIMNSRLQSTYNMLQWLDPRISDEEFRTRINEFFKFSEESVIYNGIIYHPLEYDNWFDLIFIHDEETNHRTDIVISVEAAKLRLAGLQRYLESYRYNTGLNFLSGILRMYTGSFRGTEGEWRLNESLQSVKENLDIESQRAVIADTLKIVGHFELLEKDMMAEAIIKYFPEYVREIFAKVHDRYSLSMILEEPTSRLNKILEDI